MYVNLEGVKDIIKEQLKEAAIKGEPLVFHENLRGIGKTTALIEFAKEYGLNVVVRGLLEAKHYREKYEYERIYSAIELLEPSKRIDGGVVYDEGVSKRDLLAARMHVVTGIEVL